MRPKFGPPTVLTPPNEQFIDLGDALMVAGIENPTIALAEEAVRASEALRMQARVLLLPTLNAGTSVRIHQGTLLAGTGLLRHVNIQSVYVGAGAGAATAGTIEVPGIRLFAHLGDAYYAPQAAQQVVVSRQFDAIAIRHRTLLEVGTAYLTLAGAQGQLDALRLTEAELGEVARLTTNQVKAGQGRDSDAQRAQSNALLVQVQIAQAEEAVGVAAADLGRLLDLDPSVPLRAIDSVPPIIELIDPATPLSGLIETAMAGHPELAARSADIAWTQIRIRQEKVRPWLPVVSAGLSAGSFGGIGSQSPDLSWGSGARLDFDVYAVWSLQNLGVGNRALQNRTEAEAGEAAAERARVADRIRREVAEAHALILVRRGEIDLAGKRVDTARKAFEADMVRIKNLAGRPIELLRSLELLATARLDLVRAMAGYSQAQLQLHVAIGNSPPRR